MAKASNRLRLRVEFKVEDAWIGVFWRRSVGTLDVLVCLIPCFPLHVTRLDAAHYAAGWRLP